MATKIKVGGKLVKRPGVYATIKSGITNPPLNLDYGHIAILDDGIGAGAGGGIGGVLQSFDKVEDYQAFMKSGVLWDLGDALYKPLPGFNGASKVSVIHAREATSAVISLALTNGTFTLTTKDQGINANGQLTSGALTRGYAAKLVPTPLPTASFTSKLVTAAASGVSMVRAISVANVVIGNMYNVEFVEAAVTVNFLASTTNATDVLNGISAIITGNSTLNPLFDQAMYVNGSSTQMNITRLATNTPFTINLTVTNSGTTGKLRIEHSSYKGIDSLNNTPYDGISSSNATPLLVAESPVFSTTQVLLDWLNSDPLIADGFTVGFTGAGGAVVSGDYSSHTGYILATGGTETYSQAAYNAALAQLQALDFSFIVSTHSGSEAISTQNDDLVNLAKTGKYQRYVFIPGGSTKAEYEAYSVPAAVNYDAEEAIVVHGDAKKTVRNGFKRISVLKKCAYIAGRLAGLPPQAPLTFKKLDFDAEWEALTDDQLDDSLDKGVLVTYLDEDFGYVVVLEDVNSLQLNENLVNDDATSFNIALCRIKRQLSKEACLYLKKKFFSDQTAGPNRNTITETDLAQGLDTFLASRIARTNQDNLIIKYGNITVSILQDGYVADYDFIANSEINKMIIRGTIKDSF